MSTGYDGAVGLFTRHTGQFEILGYHEHLANSIAVDQNQRVAASCSSDYTVWLWDITSRKPILRLRGHTDDVEAFVFITTELGASASRDHTILLHNLRSGQIVGELYGHAKDVLSLSAAGDLLFSCGDDKTLRAWNLLEGREVRRWGPFEHETDSCAVDPTRTLAALGCDDGHVRMIDLLEGDVIFDVQAHCSGIKKVAFAETGELVTAAYDQQIVVFSPAAGMRQLARIDVPTGLWERSLNWAGPGSLVAGTFRGTVLLWDDLTHPPRELGGPTPGNPCLNDVAVANNTAAMVADDGLVRIMRLASSGWRVSATIPTEDGTLMNAVALDESGTTVFAGRHDGRVQKWRVRPSNGSIQTGEARLTEGPVNSIATLPFGNALVGCYSGTVVSLDHELGVRHRWMLHDEAVKIVRASAVNRVAGSCGADGAIQLWDSATGQIISRLRSGGTIVNDVAFSPDGSLLAAVGRDFALSLFEVASGSIVDSVTLGSRSLKSVAFLSNTVVVVGDYWGGIWQVDLLSGYTCYVTVSRNGISAIAPCGDGSAMAVSYDGCVFRLGRDVTLRTRIASFMEQRPCWA